MRRYPSWIKTTQQEDKEILRALVDSLLAGPNHEQIKTLSDIKKYMLDMNNDLMTPIYDQFLLVTQQLGIAPPERTFDPSNPESGSWYIIPAKGKETDGHTHEQRLKQRDAKRQHNWLALVSSAGYTVGEVEVLLSSEDTKLGEIRALFTRDINQVADDLRGEMRVMNATIDRLRCEIADLKQFSDTIAECVLGSEVSNEGELRLT